LSHPFGAGKRTGCEIAPGLGGRRAHEMRAPLRCERSSLCDRRSHSRRPPVPEAEKAKKSCQEPGLMIDPG